MANIVEQKIWDAGYKNFKYRVLEDELTAAIEAKLQALAAVPPKGGSCFEVGCYPCQYLAAFGIRYGLTMNGVDLTDAMGPELQAWLDSLPAQCGDVVKADAFEYIHGLCAAGTGFDVVYSLGFIEHFDNYLEVIDLHDEIVKPGGLLILGTPNFRGKVQNYLHRRLDPENLSRHVVRSMDPVGWAEHLGDRYELLYAGYAGGIGFYFADEPRSFGRRVLNKAVLLTRPLWQKLKGESPDYSQYCLLIARKK